MLTYYRCIHNCQQFHSSSLERVRAFRCYPTLQCLQSRLGQSQFTQRSKAGSRSLSTCTLSAGQEASSNQTSSVEAEVQQTVPLSESWELDFSSRPILDERGKKVWEVLITDAERTFQYSRFLPNNKINSTQVPNCCLQSWPAIPAFVTAKDVSVVLAAQICH